MKKCPYCAEEIKDEAIVCRYCGRDLVPNVNELVNSQSGTKIHLTNNQVDELSIIFMNNIKSPSLNWITNLQDILKKMGGETIAPIFDLFLEKKLMTENVFQREIEVAVAHNTIWGLVCFGVGFEHGLNNLDMERGIKFTIALTENLGMHYAGYLHKLSTNGGITEEKSIVLTEFITGKILRTALMIHQFGIENCQTINKKSNKFLDAINNI